MTIASSDLTPEARRQRKAKRQAETAYRLFRAGLTTEGCRGGRRDQRNAHITASLEG